MVPTMTSRRSESPRRRSSAVPIGHDELYDVGVRDVSLEACSTKGCQTPGAPGEPRNPEWYNARILIPLGV